MPSAAAKKKRAALRASQCKVSKDTGCCNETNLDDEVAKFNEGQHEFNERRRALLQRISERETQRCMQQISKAPPQVAQSRPSGANISAVRSSQSGANGTESHGQTTQADRSSQGGQSETESHGQMAHMHPGIVRENPLTLVQNTYPQRVIAASTAAVQELLELLNMYEPPSEPVARESFESQVYVKVKRILKNQKQRAYRKAKKQGFLHL